MSWMQIHTKSCFGGHFIPSSQCYHFQVWLNSAPKQEFNLFSPNMDVSFPRKNLTFRIVSSSKRSWACSSFAGVPTSKIGQNYRASAAQTRSIFLTLREGHYYLLLLGSSIVLCCAFSVLLRSLGKASFSLSFFLSPTLLRFREVFSFFVRSVESVFWGLRSCVGTRVVRRLDGIQRGFRPVLGRFGGSASQEPRGDLLPSGLPLVSLVHLSIWAVFLVLVHRDLRVRGVDALPGFLDRQKRHRTHLGG